MVMDSGLATSSRPGMTNSLRFHECTPAAETRNVARILDAVGFGEKTLHGAAAAQHQRANREWRRDRADEAPKTFRRQCPDFDCDRRALPGRDAQQPRPRRLRREGEHFVIPPGVRAFEKTPTE